VLTGNGNPSTRAVNSGSGNRALSRTEMSMIRWMCGFSWFEQREKSTGLRELMGLDSVSLVIKKDRSRWFGHVECKGGAHWIKSCTVVQQWR